MTCHARAIRLLAPAVLMLAALASSADAQSLLRVLRFLPAGIASPSDSLIVAFDRPIAPRLEGSVDPNGVVRLTPDVPSTSYWRDPSTLVVRFDRPLAYGGSYRVAFSPNLRSAEGVRLAPGQERELRVPPPRALALVPSTKRGMADLLQRPLIVFQAPVPLTSIAATLRYEDCGSTGYIPLTPESIRPVSRDDPPEIREAGGHYRDRRLDSLRRVVRFVASEALAQGCYVSARVLSDTGGGPSVLLIPFRTQPSFRLVGVRCSDDPCERGNLAIAFTRLVKAEQIIEHVRVDGKPVKIPPFDSGSGGQPEWWLAQSVSPGREVVVEVDGALTDATGESLGADARHVVKAIHARPRVEFTSGPIVVPRDANVAFILRHVNTDSIVLTLGRVHDSICVQAITRPAFEYRAKPWPMEADSVVRVIATPAPLDSERVMVIPTSWIPKRWSAEPVLMLRARPALPTTTERARWEPYAILQRTTLAAHALSHRGAVDVWVTDLRGGGAVADARLRVIGVNGRELARGSTDARGRARLRYATRDTSVSGQTASLLEVERGETRLLLAIPDDAASAPPGDENPDTPYAFRVGGDMADGRTLHGAAFVDRGIYRPGEHVFLKGMVRTSGLTAGFATPSGDSARWTIYYGDGEERERLARTPTKLTAFGTSESGF